MFEAQIKPQSANLVTHLRGDYFGGVSTVKQREIFYPLHIKKITSACNVVQLLK